MTTPQSMMLALSSALFACALCRAEERQKIQPIAFAGQSYFHRWSGGEQHEFTPSGQEDMAHWSDMITINHYPKAADGEGLASIANTVIDIYKQNGALIVKTDAVPKTADKPAEYLIVALFPQHESIEAVFARFKIVDSVGAAAIYSHREYGEKIGDVMSAWLKEHGPSSEKALMRLEPIPSRKSLAGKGAQPDGRSNASEPRRESGTPPQA